MLDSKRNIYATVSSVIALILMASLFAACRPVPIPIPIPVSTSGTPMVLVVIKPQSSPAEISTPQPPTAIAVPEPPTETAPDQPADTVSATTEGAPAPMSHKFVGREDCLDCHEVGNGKNAAPSDHQGFGNDFCLYCHSPGEADVAVPPLPEDASPEFCLGCHGPYEDLLDRTADTLTDEDGVKANPHIYVPHDSTTITSCKYCHDVHALSVIPEEIPKADAGYCFAACHHEQNYEPCSDCH